MMRIDKPFWETLASGGAAPAIEEAATGLSWSYRSLAGRVEALAEVSNGCPRGVVFIFGTNDFGAVASYLGCLLAGHAVYLLSIKVDHPSVGILIERYRPEMILTRVPPVEASLGGHYTPAAWEFGYQRYIRKICRDPPPEAALALLLSTSASTGDPKTVRISRSALAASAEQVIAALNVTADDHAVTSLPFTHVYGLSVINSHLAAGGKLSLEKRSVADTGFWAARAGSPWSTLPGVTITYELMRQKHLDSGMLKGVRKLLHAGGKMPPGVFSWLHPTVSVHHSAIYLMYGQTEACGRISVLDPKLLPERASSVGTAVTGGHICISDEGEIIYRGPNVMLGYARCREDLNGKDHLGGVLSTGDRGYLDEGGLLFVTGRDGRTCKVFGERICLDDVEEFLGDTRPTAAVRDGEHILLFSEAAEQEMRSKLVTLAKTFRVPPQTFVLRPVRRLPRTESGKISYRDLVEPGRVDR